MLIPHHRKSSLLKHHHFRYREKYCFEKHHFLTFGVNEIDAFQKVIIFEESETLPGGKTFGGIQKVYVFKNKHFPKTNQKVYEFPMFPEQESIYISNGLNDFRKCTF